MSTVKNVHRPLVSQITGGPSVGDAVQLGDALRVEVDLDNDGRRIAVLVLTEADHPGLIAEYEAGVATTVLEAAIDTAVAALADVDELSAAQVTNVIGKAVSWPAP